MGERLGRKDFLPVEPKASLLPLSPRQTLGSPKTTPLSCPAAPYPSFDTRGRPSCSRVPFAAKTFYAPRFAQVPPFKSSTASRSCACGLFPRPLCWCFALEEKIWHSIFFSKRLEGFRRERLANPQRFMNPLQAHCLLVNRAVPLLELGHGEA
jgi:hypothetical protein